MKKISKIIFGCLLFYLLNSCSGSDEEDYRNFERKDYIGIEFQYTGISDADETEHPETTQDIKLRIWNSKTETIISNGYVRENTIEWLSENIFRETKINGYKYEAVYWDGTELRLISNDHKFYFDYVRDLMNP